MDKILSVFIFFLLGSINLLLAQFTFEDGFIINLQNDTIQGKIMISDFINYQDSVRFLKGSKQIEDTKTYSPVNLIGFSSTEKGLYKSVLIKDELENQKRVFLKELVEGSLSFYSIPDGQKGFRALFVVKDNEIAIRLNSRNFKTTLQELTVDCPIDLIQEQLSFSPFSISKKIRKYNQCDEINRQFPDEKSTTFTKGLTGYYLINVDAFDFNQIVSNANSAEISRSLYGISLFAEVKKKYYPAVRFGINLQYMGGFQEVIYNTSGVGFRNSHQSFGIIPRLSLFYPRNTQGQIYVFVGVGYILDYNSIDYDLPSQIDQAYFTSHVTNPLGIGVRWTGKKTFMQLELGAFHSLKQVGLGIGF